MKIFNRRSDVNEYRGSRLSFLFLVVLTAVATGRSLAHIFLPDGGAQSIAGMDVEVEGGNNIIAMFGQWGFSQLLLAGLMWVIIFKQRHLVPLALLFQTLDWGGRILVGLLKPVEIASAPPGEIGSYVLFPLCVIALWFSMPRAKR
ncbi:MAG: hypothetical protein RL024_45 [Actinomycetota bacterium]|jgi:hypothetical protein